MKQEYSNTNGSKKNRYETAPAQNYSAPKNANAHPKNAPNGSVPPKPVNGLPNGTTEDDNQETVGVFN